MRDYLDRIGGERLKHPVHNTLLLPGQVQVQPGALLHPLVDRMSRIKGLPVYSTLTSSGRPGPGAAASESITITTEVKSLSEEALTDSMFAIPPDYREISVAKPGEHGVAGR